MAKERHYCIFTANYLPNLGGVERYTYNLARGLTAQGNKVTVVTSNVFSLPAQEEADRVDVIRMPCWNVLGGRFPVLKPGARFRELDAVLNGKNFDFVIVQTRFYIHSLYGASFARRRGIPCITIEHGTNHFTVNHKVLDFLGHIYEHMISILVKRNCRHFYGVSADCCNWLRHFRIEADGILYNAVDVDDIKSKIEGSVENYREALSLQQKIIVTYAGRLVKEKGVLKLIDAVAGLQAGNSDIVLLIAGDGDLYQDIQKKSLPWIYMLGKLDFAHVVSLLSNSDIFCLPTDYPEGFPTSVLEAVACRCYVVTTTNGGSKELLIDENYGAVLLDNSVEKIAEAIEYASKNEAYRESAVQRTYLRLCERFTWKSTTLAVMEAAGKLEKGEYFAQKTTHQTK